MEFNISESEGEMPYQAWKELELQDLHATKGEEVLKYMEENHKRGIVLAGRPYHVDPKNQPYSNLSIPMESVYLEDSISHLGELERPLIVMDQWMYHTRLYSAANYKNTR